jgi:hypothetical protein
VVRGIVDRSVTAPVGCHYFHDEERDVWEVTLFISRTEILGGPGDGRVVLAGLQIDIAVVTAAFDSPPAVYWQAERVHDDDELGSHLSFEGMARRHSVWLRILQQAPEWTAAGRVLNAGSGDFEDRW